MNLTRRADQQGFLLFTGVFLITVVTTLAATLALMAAQQQVSTLQSLGQTQAYYAAFARLETEIATFMTAASSWQDLCDNRPVQTKFGFTTRVISCQAKRFEELDTCPGNAFWTLTLEVVAERGKRRAGTLVRRKLLTQIQRCEN